MFGQDFTLIQLLLSFPEITLTHYNFTDEQAKKIAEAAMNNKMYNYFRISNIVDMTIQPYVNAMKKAKENYEKMHSIDFVTDIDQTTFVLFTGTESYTVDYNTVLFYDINIDTPPPAGEEPPKYPIREIFPYMLAHFGTDDNGYYDHQKSYASFKSGNNAKLNIDGVKVYAKDFIRDKKIQRTHFTIVTDENNNVIYFSNSILDASNGDIKIKYIDKEKYHKKIVFSKNKIKQLKPRAMQILQTLNKA